MHKSKWSAGKWNPHSRFEKPRLIEWIPVCRCDICTQCVLPLRLAWTRALQIAQLKEIKCVEISQMQINFQFIPIWSTWGSCWPAESAENKRESDKLVFDEQHFNLHVNTHEWCSLSLFPSLAHSLALYFLSHSLSSCPFPLTVINTHMLYKGLLVSLMARPKWRLIFPGLYLYSIANDFLGGLLIPCSLVYE